MNAYKPLLIFNIMKSVRLLADGCASFGRFLVAGSEPNRRQIATFVERSLMLVTALSPVIGHDKAAQTARYALDHDLTLRQAALALGVVSAEEFDRIVDPEKMTRPSVPGG
jgi:fumarate hydratase class II